ncbi:hypothetical protein FRC10_007767 [Ceratobasidium sp. 414]|nr:hypothetical protein FRC10_007767 [Ceratobasidium sp. 414]
MPLTIPSLPESPKTRQERPRVPMRKTKVTVGAEEDPSRKPPAQTLTRFVTDVLHRSRTSINVLQVALAYVARAKRIPQSFRETFPGMDWLGSEFTPSPLTDPRRTFLASLVLASKFLLDKAPSNKAWAKLTGLEALEVGKCERALGTALDWRLWVGQEASRECVVPAPNMHNYPSPAHSTLTLSQPSVSGRRWLGRWENPTSLSPHENASPAQSSSPLSTVFTQGSTPSLAFSETSSKSDAPHGGDEPSMRVPTPEPEEMLHGSPIGHLSAAMGSSMRLALEPVIHTRLVLPPLLSFDRLVLRRGPAKMILPQLGSNLGYACMLPVSFERASNESPLAHRFAEDRDFNQGRVVTA